MTTVLGGQRSVRQAIRKKNAVFRYKFAGPQSIVMSDLFNLYSSFSEVVGAFPVSPIMPLLLRACRRCVKRTVCSTFLKTHYVGKKGTSPKLGIR